MPTVKTDPIAFVRSRLSSVERQIADKRARAAGMARSIATCLTRCAVAIEARERSPRTGLASSDLRDLPELLAQIETLCEERDGLAYLLSEHDATAPAVQS